LIAKVMQPEVEEPKTLGKVQIEFDKTATNLIEAAGIGTIEGLRLALNVGAMLIAFIALVTMVNVFISWAGVSMGLGDEWTLQRLLGILFYPFAWLMGIPSNECWLAGELLGTKMALNEFIAYNELGQIITADKELAEGGTRQLSERSVTILTYALCGFANFSSIGIQLGGIGGIAPERQSDLARLGFRAMLGGTLAAFMTACIAGILL
jgi:CNT family concentrative nucleoside transporter